MFALKPLQRFLITAIIIGFCAGTVFAEEDTAVLSLMIGEVQFCGAETGEWIDAAEGMKLAAGDKVKTGIDGMVSIVFSNGSTVSLKQNAEFQVQSLISSPDSKDLHCQLKLMRGQLRAMIEKLDEGSTFEIQTPTAVAAVRGTVFYLYVTEVSGDDVDPSIKEQLKTELFVEEGGVIYTCSSTGQYYAVNAGQFSESRGDGSITIPVDIPEDKQQEWKEGWENILNAEPYQEPGEGDEGGTTGDDGNTDDNSDDTRQTDQGGQNEPTYSDLAREASDEALAAAARAAEAAGNAADAYEELAEASAALGGAEDAADAAYNDALNALSGAQGAYADAESRVNSVQEAIDALLGEKAYEYSMVSELKVFGAYVTETSSGIDALYERLEELLGEIENVQSYLTGPAEGSSLGEQLQDAKDAAEDSAAELELLMEQLSAAITEAVTAGNDAALEGILVLIEQTMAAINRANAAADHANEVADNIIALLEANGENIGALLADVDDIIDELEGLTADAQDEELLAYLQNLLAEAEEILPNALEIVAVSNDAKNAAGRANKAAEDIFAFLDETGYGEYIEEELWTKYDSAWDMYCNTEDLLNDIMYGDGDYTGFAGLEELLAEAQDAIDQAVDETDNEALKTEGFLIVDIDALRDKIGALQDGVDDIGGEFSSIKDALKEFYYDLTGEEWEDFTLYFALAMENGENGDEEDNSIFGRLERIGEDAEDAFDELSYLNDQLVDAAINAFENADWASFEALNVLLELTQAAIENAEEAADAANSSAQDAEEKLAEANGLIARINGLIADMAGLEGEMQNIESESEAAAQILALLAENAEGILESDLLDAAIEYQRQYEGNVIREEIYAKLLERAWLREEIRDILSDNGDRRAEGYLEKIADAQAGKVMQDVYGNRVRVQQYILRPSSERVELLSVNLRAGDDISTMQWTTTFNQSLDTLSTGRLKDLPWEEYMEAEDLSAFVDEIIDYFEIDPDDIDWSELEDYTLGDMLDLLQDSDLDLPDDVMDELESIGDMTLADLGPSFEHMPFFIFSPYREDGIYPENMTVRFTHKSDEFAETRYFTERFELSDIEDFIDGYYDDGYFDDGDLDGGYRYRRCCDDYDEGMQIIGQALFVKNFNNDEWMPYIPSLPEIGQLPGTYSIQRGIDCPQIPGQENNGPDGFRYNFRSSAASGDITNSIGAAFYPIDDSGTILPGFEGDEGPGDIFEVIGVDMGGEDDVIIGGNNVEMIFSSTVFSSGPIDVVYIPAPSMDWKDYDHIPDYTWLED